MTTRPILLIAIVLALVIAACGGGQEPAKTGVEFLDGELPSTLPSDFPIPEDAIIGSGLIDYTNGRTELTLRMVSPIEPAAKFYDVNLVNAGYVLRSSTGSDGAWDIAFSDDTASGEISIRPLGNDVITLVVTMTDS